MQRVRFVCWITKNTDARSEYVILLLFHGNGVYANAPQCYVIRTLPVLGLLYLTVIPTFLAGDLVTVLLCVCR